MSYQFLEKEPYFLEEWERNVREKPDALILSDELHPQGMTRQETDDLSGRVYAWLKEKNIGREDIVLICLPRGILTVIAMIGVWKAGAALTIVEDTYAEERISFIRKDCGCKAEINMDHWQEIVETEPHRGYEMTDLHDAALAIYTSGTTGHPKGVLHEYGNFKMHILSKTRKENTSEEPIRFAFIAPLNFVAFPKNVISVLVTGMHLFVVPYAIVKDPLLLRRFLEDYQIKATFLSPSMIRAMKGDLPSCVKAVYTGSEPANGIVLDNKILLNVYAMSESFFSVAEFLIKKPYEICPIGKPGSDYIHIRLLDENDQETAIGETGEICVKTPFFRGYINLPEQTQASLKDGWFHTGDLAKRLDDGNMILLGRSNDMIKINGNRVEPAEIEAVVKRLLSLSWCCAKGYVRPESSFIALYYTEDIRIDEEQLRQKLGEFLPYYMIPSFFIHIDKVLLLPNGKLDKRGLPEPDVSSFRKDYIPPETQLEEKILRGFEKILKMEHLSVTDDFYALGGDSLCSIMLIEEIAHPLLNVKLLYQYRTPRKLAKAIENESNLERKSIEHRDENARKYDQPLLPIQLYLMDVQIFNPSSTFSNIPILWRMPKDRVDKNQLLRAFDRVICNHPVFQSVIRIDEDVCFVQHYDPKLKLNLSVEYMTEAELEQIKDKLIKSFKMVGELLYRIRLIETESFVYVFLDLHHLFSDGMSMHVLFRSISDAYNGRELPHDYAYLYASDYSKWNKTDNYTEAKNYFLQKYSGINWCRNFTPDMESQKSHASSVNCAFPCSNEQLNEFLEKEQLSLNQIAVMAALETLHEKEQNDNIMVSWAYSGRDDITYKDTIFPVTKELPVAISFDKLHTLKERMDEVSRQIREDLAYEMYPYVQSTSSVAVNDPFRVRSLGNMRHFSGIEGVPCEVVPLVNKNGMTSLVNIQLLEQADSSRILVLTYNDNLYYKETAEKILSLFCKHLMRIIQNGDGK